VTPSRQIPTVEVDLERPVGAGRVLGHDGEGRVVLAEGGLPGERVVVELSTDRARVAVGEVTSVLHPSADRVEPPCPAVARGCGGCDLQHATPGAQRAMKVEVLRDALAHLAGLQDPDLDPGPVLEPTGYRTTLRLGVQEGRVGFRHRRSHRLVTVDDCLVAHPNLREVLSGCRFPGAREVVLRTSQASGETLAVVDAAPGRAEVGGGVRVVGKGELRRGAAVFLHEEVHGHRLRVSARSFFQPGPAGAAALATAVADALAPARIGPDSAVADLYGGVGLFSVTLGAREGELVERSASAIADARVNTAGLRTRVRRVAVERWMPSPADAVVADPPRQGLGAAGADAVVGTGAGRLALVSCDPASLARDAALLAERGYQLVGVRLVDQFAHTHHVEAVAAFQPVEAS
jgi:23S rRNA (uracil1939-C5)-methyltransferase